MNLFAMFILSLMAGFLSTMNLWVANVCDAYLHINDFYMILLMASWMVLLMQLYFGETPHKNYFYITLNIFFIVLTLYLIRTQTFVTDTQFLKGMIPHHSMAITMSEKIKEKTNNKDIKNLAENIIKTQNEEINFMKKLLL